MSRSAKEFARPLALTLLIALLIAVFSFLPNGKLASLSGTDKLWHFGAYFCLIIPFAIIKPSLIKWVLPLGIMYGGFIEVLQPNFYRRLDLFDFVMNAFGAMSGAICGFLVNKFYLRSGSDDSASQV